MSNVKSRSRRPLKPFGAWPKNTHGENAGHPFTDVLSAPERNGMAV